MGRCNDINALGILGENIKNYREQSGKTCREFAEEIGYHRLDLAKLEYGEKNIRFSTVKRIAKKMDVPLPYLFSNEFQDYLKRSAESRHKYLEDDFLRIYSEKFKEHLRVRGRQGDLAVNVRMDNSNISKILNSQNRNPCIKTLDILAGSIDKELAIMLSRADCLKINEEEDIR